MVDKKITNKDRKLVNSVLTMGSKIPGIGAMINAGKTFKAVKNAIDKYNETKPRTGPDVTKRAKGGMVEKKKKSKKAEGGEVKKYMGGGSVHKKKNKMLTTKGWGASRKT